MQPIDRDPFLIGLGGPAPTPSRPVPPDRARSPIPHPQGIQVHDPSHVRRVLPAAVVAVAAALAVAAGPAAAAKPIVHETPKVPLVVDGKRLAPEQIHRYDGRRSTPGCRPTARR